MTDAVPALAVIPSSTIERWLDQHRPRVFELVREAYLAHHAGLTVNPDSYFLRFPDNDKTRIIALPASLEGDDPVAGIKWIASFPDNVNHGLDRASAVLILNDRRTGYPIACLEGSLISAARTAGAAAVGASALHPTPKHVERLGIVGCGPIAFQILTLLIGLGWHIGKAILSDLSPARADLLAAKAASWGISARPMEIEHTITSSDLVLFATSAVEPFVLDPAWFRHNPTVLHMSLRDLGVAVIGAAQNIVDDVDHCLKARTSLDLAVQQTGSRAVVDGTIADVINGRVKPDPARPRVFSPFGMGILDLALARAIVRSVSAEEIVTVPGFFPLPYVAVPHSTEARSAQHPQTA